MSNSVSSTIVKGFISMHVHLKQKEATDLVFTDFMRAILRYVHIDNFPTYYCSQKEAKLS